MPVFMRVAPYESRIGEAVVLYEPLHVAVERQVVAAEFPALSVLLRGDHVEGRPGRIALLAQFDGLPAVGHGLDQLAHHRVVPPTGHRGLSRPFRSRGGTARSTLLPGSCR